MNNNDLNPLILDKVKQVVNDTEVQKFIREVLEVEREYEGIKRGKMGEYEKMLARHVRRE